jgi:2-succinyl-5-enolpyruvyl-6-hydroxy-3-cyclohexene-1-carboxylate synthase
VQVVVVNDDGGGIFSLLEHGERARGGAARAETFERLFGTPHGADLAALCRGYGVPHVRVDDLAGLRAALRAPSDGFGVVEVRADRAGLRDLHAEVRAEVRAAVGAAVPAGEGQEVRNAVQ